MKHPQTKQDITKPETLEIFNSIYSFALKLIDKFPKFIDMYPDDEYVRAIGDGDKMKNICIYIQPLKDSVNLGFTKGAELSKFFPVIKGTGKNYRHIKYKKVSDIDFELLEKILIKAFEIH